jgi:predicted RNA binding protein YcfA (HicA-like mRNA interferase family)
MPPKIRELIAELEKHGFVNRGGKGSHRNYYHPKCSRIVTISGKDGNDAQKYQLKQVRLALDEVKDK